MEKKYEEIIDYEYKGVRYHPPMERLARAAQFAAFAALTGHEECIRETERRNASYHENLNVGILES